MLDPRAEVYAAPEVISGHGYDPVSVDIFALGALSYAIFSGKHPAAAPEELLAKLRSLTNLRVGQDPASDSGWSLEVGPFQGWEEVPRW